ncbi:PaaI family thioesterase [Actinopolyspora mzabensis]|nr:PaaI family thioesterase [Actinopolyspora mzabensis]
MNDGNETGHDWGEPRSKTVTWYDPTTGARAATGMSGLDYLSAMHRGELPPPPISALFGDMRISSVAEGEVEFSCLPDESAYNPIGMVHGGLACTLLDSVTGCAVHSTLPAGTGYSSAEIKVSYLRAIHLDTGELHALGRVTKPGRQVAFAEGELRDSTGKLLATASSTCTVLG